MCHCIFGEDAPFALVGLFAKNYHLCSMEKTVWDPLRKKEVALTPEEEVRQWFIRVLEHEMGVPEHMMRSEVSFTFGNSRKKYRADILVFGKDTSPVAVVECKRPETVLDSDVLDQALRYNMVMGAPWIMITNGRQTFMAHNGVFTDSIPSYNDLCTD